MNVTVASLSLCHSLCIMDIDCLEIQAVALMEYIPSSISQLQLLASSQSVSSLQVGMVVSASYFKKEFVMWYSSSKYFMNKHLCCEYASILLEI